MATLRKSLNRIREALSASKLNSSDKGSKPEKVAGQISRSEDLFAKSFHSSDQETQDQSTTVSHSSDKDIEDLSTTVFHSSDQDKEDLSATVLFSSDQGKEDLSATVFYSSDQDKEDLSATVFYSSDQGKEDLSATVFYSSDQDNEDLSATSFFSSVQDKEDLSTTVFYSSDQDKEDLSTTIFCSSDQEKDLSATVLQASETQTHDLFTTVFHSSDKDQDLSATVVHSSDQDTETNLSASTLRASDLNLDDEDTIEREESASDMIEDIVSPEMEHCRSCKFRATNQVLEARWYCKQCDDVLCNECMLSHKEFQSSKDHNLASLHPPCDNCAKKTRETAAKFFCNNCKQFLCDDCQSFHKLLAITENHTIIKSQEKVKGEKLNASQHHKISKTEEKTGWGQAYGEVQNAKGSHYDETHADKEFSRYHNQSNDSNHSYVPDQDECTGQNTELIHTDTTFTNQERKVEAKEAQDTKQVFPEIEPFNQRRPKCTARFSVLVPGDEETPWITGSAFLPDSRLLLVDNKNTKLKLFDANYKFVKCVKFSSPPSDVSVFDSSEVAIAAGGTIVRLYVKGDLIKEKGRISTRSVFNGVSYISRDMLAVTGTKVLCVYTIAGKQLSRLSLGQGTFPLHVTVDRRRARAYVSSAYSATLSAIDLNIDHTVFTFRNTNKIAFTYKHKHLHWASGVTMDKENIYVCGLSSNTIHQVSPAGEHVQILLSQEDGLYKPRTLSFTPSGETFIVGRDSQTVNVYTIQQTVE